MLHYMRRHKYLGGFKSHYTIFLLSLAIHRTSRRINIGISTIATSKVVVTAPKEHLNARNLLIHSSRWLAVNLLRTSSLVTLQRSSEKKEVYFPSLHNLQVAVMFSKRRRTRGEISKYYIKRNKVHTTFHLSSRLR
jgi:hypothetical protein